MGAQPGVPCPECGNLGEQTDFDVERNQRVLTCYDGDCGVITYDGTGLVRHMVSDPALKPNHIDEAELY